MLDGGYLRNRDIERAHEQGVELFVPPKVARTAKNRGRELQPQRRDSAAIRAWKQRMASEQGQEIYRQRASTSETINADLRTYRGLTQLTVRGLHKARCVALLVRAGLQRHALRHNPAEMKGHKEPRRAA